jgi:hypothetical protein
MQNPAVKLLFQSLSCFRDQKGGGGGWGGIAKIYQQSFIDWGENLLSGKGFECGDVSVGETRSKNNYFFGGRKSIIYINSLLYKGAKCRHHPPPPITAVFTSRARI